MPQWGSPRQDGAGELDPGDLRRKIPLNKIPVTHPNAMLWILPDTITSPPSKEAEYT
jgi:hypothetical protein